MVACFGGLFEDFSWFSGLKFLKTRGETRSEFQHEFAMNFDANSRWISTRIRGEFRVSKFKGLYFEANQRSYSANIDNFWDGSTTGRFFDRSLVVNLHEFGNSFHNGGRRCDRPQRHILPDNLLHGCVCNLEIDNQ